MTREDGSSAPAGAQTLSRGLRALRAVAQSPTGLSIAELAEHLGVHRSIAYRILAALSDARLIARGPDGRFRGSVGLIHLADGGLTALRVAVQPGLMALAEEIGATVSFFVREGDDAVALAVFESARQGFRMGFQVGDRHPLDRGAAGLAIRSLEPPAPDDPERIAEAREKGYAHTFGEVEPNLHGLSVPLLAGGLPCCINIVSNRPEVLDAAVEPAREAAERLASELRNFG
ncbi:MAG: IclR family transcriptional regulator [Protaetiibacter sp.]